ncbi:PadR family transcriptional regulator [Dactylosporangium matsuzakiense]|uniref:PadR family transcriptional regulator n=1 Tax=Dactylosporangium matsuzakiense TaxID=53360 RepID=A0A9W6KV38_9ACTN|nr:PadR family transcriptional regulator [Dactylosporangium matsuzakiense]UWZ41424.1 helix-turn-helix transcriptional regulator [Dactylosporangium matsuzakiense]GLL06980.1 PadR family transcriptional regulator [Dactylosporangium matsuzakiense]
MTTDDPPALSTAGLHVLLALGDGPRHGYAIMQAVAAESAGTVQLGPTTLYRTLRTLHDAGLVSEIAHDDPAGDARRRYYQITDAGRRAAGAQLRRLQTLIDIARTKRLIHPGLA